MSPFPFPSFHVGSPWRQSLTWGPQVFRGTLPGFPDGMVIGQHGSWNRSTLSGYKLIFVPFENGRPAGPPRESPS